jgi:hypothetical protein
MVVLHSNSDVCHMLVHVKTMVKGATGASLLASLAGVSGLAKLLSGNESNDSSNISKTNLYSRISTGADWERFGRRARVREIRGSTRLQTSPKGSTLHVLLVNVSFIRNALGVLRLYH